MNTTTWTCEHCRLEHIDRADVACPKCDRSRYASFEIQVCEHILEHIADGAEAGIVVSALDVLKAMNARPCYARINSGQGFQISYIQSRMRAVTRDTTPLARAIFKAKAANAALRIMEHGTPSELINAMAKWGPETNAEHVDHTGAVSTTVKHVYEDTPRREDGPKRD